MFFKKLILLTLLSCQFLLNEAQHLNFIKYTVYDGLVANPVRCIYQDSKGFIWIGTYDGLSRYDGYKFTNYTTSNGLSHIVINSLLEIDGKLLIAENNGAIDVIHNNTIQKKQMLKSAVNVIAPFKDRLLLTSDDNGFYEYKNDSIIIPSQENSHSSLGRLLPLNDSLLISDGIDNNLIIYRKDLSIHSEINNSGLHFFSLFKDSKKRVWAGTGNGLKLIEIQPDKNHLSITTLPSMFDFSPLNDAGITSMIEEKDGSFWISTMKGLVHLFPDGNFQLYNEKDGLPSSMIYTLFKDKENNLWVGTSLGLAKWVSKNSVVFYNTENKDFKNDVYDIILSSDKKIVLRTSHGFQNFDINTREFNNIPATSSDYTAVAGSSPLLVHHADKIEMLEASNISNTLIKKLDTSVTGSLFSCMHPDGSIFIGSFGGLFVVKNTLVKRILPDRITSLAVDKNGAVWAGTWDNGLFRLAIRPDSNTTYNVEDLSSTINPKQIRGVYADSKNNIWVGTRYDGAFCLIPKSKKTFEVEHFDRQSGLMSDWVNSFAETKTGDMWIGTYLGLDKLVKQSTGYRVFNFSKVVNFFAEIKNIVSTEDDYWICVANTGIACFKDENIHLSTPLQATILSTSLGLSENRLTIFSPTEKVFLNPNQNAARFEFGALSFINERQVLYSYRLKGTNDTTWSKPENIHEASYASLSPGHYTFEVKAIGWNGEHGAPASFSFFISTPFWKQWWFIGLVIIAVAFFFYALYKYRIRQILHLQKVRNSIATDLHDDIGSSLTNISILSELSSKNIADPEKAQPFLQRISEEVQTSSQAMDDIIWSVNSRNDSLQETMARMRRYAAELFDNSDIDCHLQLDENASDKKLSMEQRRDVYLIYKEALNNIHKHAEPNNVWVDVTQNHNHIFMHIKDDGKGFDTSSVTHRNGLKNLSSRVEKWHGKIQIGSATGTGTTINIKIPLKE
jgi:signal transduction histidine kinase/ligand-binding sensor domain-containing protein